MRQDTARAVGGALSVGWLVGVLAADLTWRSPTFSLGVLYPLSALVACAVLTPLVTAALAAGSLGLALGSAAWNHEWGTREQTIRLIDVLLVSIGAIVIAVVRARREQRFLRMAAIADAAQRAVLPTLPGRVGSISVAARYMSAAEDALVGGDLYDWYAFGELSRFIVGDVRGKGVAAAEQAARVIRAFRQAAARAPTLAEVARDMNAYLEPFLEEEEFVTALLVDATNSNRLTMISCGHPAPLLVRADGNGGEVDLPPGLPLGLGGDYRPGVVEWRPGDRVLLYTDGLTEARNHRHEFLSVAEISHNLHEKPAPDGLDDLLREVRAHVGSRGLEDDLALVLLERLPGDHEPAKDPAPFGPEGRRAESAGGTRRPDASSGDRSGDGGASTTSPRSRRPNGDEVAAARAFAMLLDPTFDLGIAVATLVDRHDRPADGAGVDGVDKNAHVLHVIEAREHL